MPSSGHTDYLSLPQWLVTDHPQMPDDLNRSFATIDAYAAGRRLQTYTALDQLGLSGPVTTSQVCAAMPPCSKLVLRNTLTDANRITDAPYDWVMVTITRPGISSDCKCAAESLDGTDRWQGVYSQESVPTFGGWVQSCQYGSWTPYFDCDSGADTITYNRQQGRYYRVGQLVIAWATIEIASKGNVSGHGLKIKGFPFPRYGIFTGYSGAFASWHNLPVGPITFEISGVASAPFSWVYSYETKNVASVGAGSLSDGSAIEGATWIYMTD